MTPEGKIADSEKSADYTYEEALADAGVLNCGEFLERYPKETSLAALTYDEYEPENL